jgi:hypothetical protein
LCAVQHVLHATYLRTAALQARQGLAEANMPPAGARKSKQTY